MEQKLTDRLAIPIPQRFQALGPNPHVSLPAGEWVAPICRFLWGSGWNGLATLKAKVRVWPQVYGGCWMSQLSLSRDGVLFPAGAWERDAMS